MNNSIVKSTSDIVLALANAGRVGPEQVGDLIQSIYERLKLIEIDSYTITAPETPIDSSVDASLTFERRGQKGSKNAGGDEGASYLDKALTDDIDTLEGQDKSSKGVDNSTASASNTPISESQILSLKDEILAVHESTTGSTQFKSEWLGVFPDRIICFEDKKECVLLKSYLRKFSLTPDQYRKKWHLPDDYPMIPPHYLANKREAALKVGLGREVRSNRRMSADII